MTTDHHDYSRDPSYLQICDLLDQRGILTAQYLAFLYGMPPAQRESWIEMLKCSSDISRYAMTPEQLQTLDEAESIVRQRDR